MAGQSLTGHPSTIAAEEPTVRELLAVLSRRRRVIVAFALVVFVVAMACSLLQPSRYTAQARILIEQRASEQVIDGTNQPTATDRQSNIDTEVHIIGSAVVRDRVIQQFGAGTPAPVIAAVQDTDLVSIGVTSTDPELAAAVANATANAYISFRLESTRADLLSSAAVLQGQIDAVQARINRLDAESRHATGAQQAAALVAQEAANTQYGNLTQQADSLRLQASIAGRDATLVGAAPVPGHASSPKPLKSGVLALAVGLVFGGMLAYVVEFFDDRLESQAVLEQLLPDIPVLGIVPVYASWMVRDETHVASREEPDGSVAEGFRGLRVALQFVGAERHYKVLQVTSASTGEGKSSTAVNLAVMYALAGSKVVLVDADLRRPRLHRFMGTPNGVGLSTALLKGLPPSEVGQDVEAFGFRFIAAGPTPSFPTELLQSTVAEQFFESCRADADVLIIDSAPILPVADSLALSAHADAVLLVVSGVRSQARNVRRASALLGSVAANVVGTVLNEASPTASGADRYAEYRAEDLTPRRRLEKLFRPDQPA